MTDTFGTVGMFLKKGLSVIVFALVAGLCGNARALQSHEHTTNTSRSVAGTVTKVVVQEDGDTAPRIVVACRPNHDLAYACAPGNFIPQHHEKRSGSQEVGGECTYMFSCAFDE